jgi:hypothetical protein
MALNKSKGSTIDHLKEVGCKLCKLVPTNVHKPISRISEGQESTYRMKKIQRKLLHHYFSTSTELCNNKSKEKYSMINLLVEDIIKKQDEYAQWYENDLKQNKSSEDIKRSEDTAISENKYGKIINFLKQLKQSYGIYAVSLPFIFFIAKLCHDCGLISVIIVSI